MPKLYPIKYRFQSPDIKPLREDIWFKSHQELLLKVANCREGRDLLCIDKSFDGLPIVGIAKNRVTGLLGFENGKAILMSNFRVGAKWGNIIRSRWPEFVALAKGYYSHKSSNLCRIRLNDEYLLAATTSTFYPDPHPETTTVDGVAQRVVVNGSWSSYQTSTGTASNDSGAAGTVNFLKAGTASGLWSQLHRSIYLFDTSPLPDGDTISSAILSLYGTNVIDNFSLSLVITDSNPASNTALAAGDYLRTGTNFINEKADRIAYSAWNTSGYNDFTIVAPDSNISKTGITKLGSNSSADFDNNEPTWASGVIARADNKFADETGTGTDPKLVVIHEAAVAAAITRRGLGIGLNKGLGRGF